MNSPLHPFENWLLLNAESMQVSLFFIVFGILAIVEIYLPFRGNGTQKSKRWLTNLGLTMLNILLLSALPVTFFTIGLQAMENGFGLLNTGSLPLWLAITMTLLLRGFISFFTHFLMHKIPIFWRVHRVHHLDTEMDVSTTVRFHPFEFIIGLVVGVPLVAVFGFSPYVLLLYEVLDAIITLFSHANIRVPRYLECWLRYLIVTPDLHRVHHSTYHVETDSNYGAVFPIWDIIFRTFRTKTQEETKEMKLGLNEVRDRRTTSIVWLIISPFYRFRKQPRQSSRGKASIDQSV
jgi:sterol desaturase/sphingolipid hydroxylase (fatty acid hydroxylase superfamily)